MIGQVTVGDSEENKASYETEEKIRVAAEPENNVIIKMDDNFLPNSVSGSFFMLTFSFTNICNNFLVRSNIKKIN